jgi:hypothetical protein
VTEDEADEREGGWEGNIGTLLRAGVSWSTESKRIGIWIGNTMARQSF